MVRKGKWVAISWRRAWLSSSASVSVLVVVRVR